MTHRSRAGCRRGATAVEAAIVLPVIVVALLGLLEIGALLEAQQALNTATREGARRASSGLAGSAGVRQVVLDSLGVAGVRLQNVAVTVEVVGAPGGTDAAAAARGQRLRVRASVPIADVCWVLMNRASTLGRTVSAETIWCCVKEPN